MGSFFTRDETVTRRLTPERVAPPEPDPASIEYRLSCARSDAAGQISPTFLRSMVIPKSSVDDVYAFVFYGSYVLKAYMQEELGRPVDWKPADVDVAVSHAQFETLNKLIQQFPDARPIKTAATLHYLHKHPEDIPLLKGADTVREWLRVYNDRPAYMPSYANVGFTQYDGKTSYIITPEIAMDECKRVVVRKFPGRADESPEEIWADMVEQERVYREAEAQFDEKVRPLTMDASEIHDQIVKMQVDGNVCGITYPLVHFQYAFTLPDDPKLYQVSAISHTGGGTTQQAMMRQLAYTMRGPGAISAMLHRDGRFEYVNTIGGWDLLRQGKLGCSLPVHIEAKYRGRGFTP